MYITLDGNKDSPPTNITRNKAQFPQQSITPESSGVIIHNTWSWTALFVRSGCPHCTRVGGRRRNTEIGSLQVITTAQEWGAKSGCSEQLKSNNLCKLDLPLFFSLNKGLSGLFASSVTQHRVTPRLGQLSPKSFYIILFIYLNFGLLISFLFIP